MEENKEGNKLKKIMIIFLSILLFAIIILTVLYNIDMNRMKNNKPVIFSNWGYSYSALIKLPEKEINDAITEYIVNKLDNEHKQYENEKGFVSFKTYLIEEKNRRNQKYNIYAWVLAEKYYLENEELKQESGSSIPYKFVVEFADDKYIVTESKIPRDGSYYTDDMKKIFPNSVLGYMNKVHSDGTINELSADIKNQAKIYFNIHDKTVSIERNESESATTKVVVVKINENDALVMGTNKELYRIGLKYFEDIELKINQELIVYHDGMILTISPAQFGSIQKIELIKEESEIEIPEDVMRYAYSSKDNVNVTINELTNSSITLSITDTNKYPYEYSHSYTITQKIKNENYTGVGQYIGEKTNTSTQGYTRNWLSIFMERSK